MMLRVPFAALFGLIALIGAAPPALQLQFDGRWEIVRGIHDGRFGDASARSFHPGDAMIVRLNGAGFRIYGITGPTGGHGMVMLRDRPDQVVDFYSPRKRPDVLLYTSPPGAYHVAALVVAPTHDPQSHGTYVNIDNVVAVPPR